LIQLKDKAKTRVALEAITSYSADFDLLPPSGKVDTLILTLGSAVRKLSYMNPADREADITMLDTHFNVDNNLR
jgi:hypothetical protein